MQTYVIHNPATTEREALVAELVRRAGATVYPAILQRPGWRGCLASHMAVYQHVPPAEDVLVFEDDCEILAPDFLDPLKLKPDYDLIYLGMGVPAAPPLGLGNGGHVQSVHQEGEVVRTPVAAVVAANGAARQICRGWPTDREAKVWLLSKELRRAVERFVFPNVYTRIIDESAMQCDCPDFHYRT